MTETMMPYLMFILVIVTGITFIFYLKRRRIQSLPVDEMEGHDFEYYCADLLSANGFQDVEVTRGSGDFGVDILAKKEDITYAFQCKCYDKPIGVKAVQEVYAGKDYYDRMIGVVITNQYFTEPAVKLASKLNVILWDRDYLNDLIGE